MPSAATEQTSTRSTSVPTRRDRAAPLRRPLGTGPRHMNGRLNRLDRIEPVDPRPVALVEGADLIGEAAMPAPLSPDCTVGSFYAVEELMAVRPAPSGPNFRPFLRR